VGLFFFFFFFEWWLRYMCELEGDLRATQLHRLPNTMEQLTWQVARLKLTTIGGGSSSLGVHLEGSSLSGRCQIKTYPTGSTQDRSPNPKHSTARRRDTYHTTELSTRRQTRTGKRR
jgi:hypothetical protein